MLLPSMNQIALRWTHHYLLGSSSEASKQDDLESLDNTFGMNRSTSKKEEAEQVNPDIMKKPSCS
ncbi:unnamed protein product [Debaryomyces tyrocola]|nr:unnamed protein product [Debaryomyces tyrocola]